MSPPNCGRTIRCLGTSRLPFRNDSGEHMLDGLQLARLPVTEKLCQGSFKRKKKRNCGLEQPLIFPISCQSFPVRWVSAATAAPAGATAHSTRIIIALPLCNLCNLLVVGKKKNIACCLLISDKRERLAGRVALTLADSRSYIFINIPLAPAFILSPPEVSSLSGPVRLVVRFQFLPICVWLVALPNARVQSWNSCTITI